MEEKSGGWEKIILAENWGKEEHRAFLMRLRSDSAGDWEETTAQSKHNENIPVAIVALLSERGAKSSCQGALALLGQVPVSLWCCGMYSIESRFWHREQKPARAAPSPALCPLVLLPSAAGDSPRSLCGSPDLEDARLWVSATGTGNSSKREISALSCLMGCQVLWDAKSGSGISTFFPFAIWCYSWLHCGKDLQLRERNSEGGQMAGVWTFFRPCAFWIHLLCFVCQNMSLLWATKATGFKINKCSPRGWQPRWLLCDPILLLQEAMRTANEFT